ncbi:hypothetical protein ACPWT1_10950 [Ramlibacter sp. MMS24-I3-19]|uniref:hypothetical protein n=1 Tax=Ramlibacter sp. MMS24-I3-19 TaxID=3416606 RepID=UPI003D021990
MSNILILGASYGSLLATKLAMAGHRVRLVCSSATADLINREGTIVRFPRKEAPGTLQVHSRELPGYIDAAVPDDVEPRGHDMAVLAMQEAQYADPAVRGLMQRIAAARVPCLALMNMPPPPFLRRLPGLDLDLLAGCYAAPDAWDDFDPALVTLASPDPQAFRPAGEGKNVLVVGLPTNFKAATFEDAAATALLRRLAADIERHPDVPVKLKVHDSPFVPLAKWPMLVTGNYRCVEPEGMVSIRRAVHRDLDRSRAVYEWAMDLCCRLGASPEDLVPFDKYAQAAASLQKPSSAARALSEGAMHIERVDQLVHAIATQLHVVHDDCRGIVATVDARLRGNRAAAVRQDVREPVLQTHP